MKNFGMGGRKQYTLDSPLPKRVDDRKREFWGAHAPRVLRLASSPIVGLMVHSYCVALEGAAARAPQTAREARALPRLCAFLPDNCLRLSRSAYERTSSSNWHNRWQRSLPDGGVARYDRTQNRHTVWTAVGRTRRWKIRRASGLFFAAAWPRPSDSAARNKSPRQY